ncbi:hypothetical protein ADL15_34355 [Actinoplanes awajinensis subsp. mycoplanecinus]|uniref:Uncharacterized protein n=1 Tax=Actinoplanes awajinensis subsp. mycoplanecinus TaxID=135947 RepID=A0A101JJ21_9ACTN|nr:hypothetical protein ADL15_34355 [Actinoplanes awajinensis subsp. mycoplanecinus]
MFHLADEVIDKAADFCWPGLGIDQGLDSHHRHEKATFCRRLKEGGRIQIEGESFPVPHLHVPQLASGSEGSDRASLTKLHRRFCRHRYIEGTWFFVDNDAGTVIDHLDTLLLSDHRKRSVSETAGQGWVTLLEVDPHVQASEGYLRYFAPLVALASGLRLTGVATTLQSSELYLRQRSFSV